MKFVNDYDIAAWLSVCENVGGNLESAVLILSAVMDDANSYSDGWSYWKAPCMACQKLIALIEAHIRPPTAIHAADLRKALAPIRSFYTRQHKTNPSFPAVPRYLERHEYASWRRIRK